MAHHTSTEMFRKLNGSHVMTNQKLIAQRHMTQLELTQQLKTGKEYFFWNILWILKATFTIQHDFDSLK